jgi:hypothetical protein
MAENNALMNIISGILKHFMLNPDNIDDLSVSHLAGFGNIGMCEQG